MTTLRMRQHFVGAGVESKGASGGFQPVVER